LKKGPLKKLNQVQKLVSDSITRAENNMNIIDERAVNCSIILSGEIGKYLDSNIEPLEEKIDALNEKIDELEKKPIMI